MFAWMFFLFSSKESKFPYALFIAFYFILLIQLRLVRSLWKRGHSIGRGVWRASIMNLLFIFTPAEQIFPIPHIFITENALHIFEYRMSTNSGLSNGLFTVELNAKRKSNNENEFFYLAI